MFYRWCVRVLRLRADETATQPAVHRSSSRWSCTTIHVRRCSAVCRWLQPLGSRSVESWKLLHSFPPPKTEFHRSNNSWYFYNLLHRRWTLHPLTHVALRVPFQTSLVIDCLLACELVWRQTLCVRFNHLRTFTATLSTLRDHAFDSQNPRAIRDPRVNPPENIKRWKLHAGFSFNKRLYIIGSAVFERGGPACLSWIGPLFYCESVGAEFCLSKQLAAAHDRRLSWRDLFHPEIRLSPSYDSSKQCAASRPEVRSSIKYAIRLIVWEQPNAPKCFRWVEISAEINVDEIVSAALTKTYFCLCALCFFSSHFQVLQFVQPYYRNCQAKVSSCADVERNLFCSNL